MDNAIASAHIDGCEKDNPHQQCRAEEEDYFSKSLVRGVKPEDVLLLNVEKSQFGEFCVQKLFLQRSSSVEKRIPKQITSLDEMYLRRCMEVIHISALRAASSYNPTEIDVFSNKFSSRLISTGSAHDGSFAFASGTGSGVTGPTGDSILGTLTGSTSMINILKSPLFRQLGGASDNAVNIGRTNLLDFIDPINSSVRSSTEDFCLWPPQTIEKERAVLKGRKVDYQPVHKRLVSVSSSTNSTFSDASSSSSSTTFCQGMLHCSWNSGFPHYEFSIGDQEEIYLANLSKVELSDDKVLDYVYTFHSKSGGKRGDAIHEKASNLVGKMRVCNSFTLCPNNIEIMETQFVLCALSDNFLGEIQTSSETHRKNKGLSKKMGDAFRSGHHSYRQRTPSKFWGSSVIPENSLEPCQNSSSTVEQVPSRTSPSENNVAPNLELAAIIVKKHNRENLNKKVEEFGGWGMKFLKKPGNRESDSSSEATAPCEYCRSNSGDCSTSMEVLLPAGLHGGPRTRNGGPSSLIERWREHGRCDCGGWDIGCPLTVLNTKPSNKQILPQVDVPGINSFDLFVQGSKQNALVVKIVNIHDGLYYVQYESTLSALQSLSIAVAIIHSRSPTLRPKVYRS